MHACAKRNISLMVIICLYACPSVPVYIYLFIYLFIGDRTPDDPLPATPVPNHAGTDPGTLEPVQQRRGYSNWPAETDLDEVQAVCEHDRLK